DRAGDKAGSLEILENVLATDPGLSDANITYIEHLTSVGRYEEAEAALARWARIRPDDSQVALERTQLLIAEGRLADAWREALALESKAAEIGRLLGQVQWRIRLRLYDGQWILDNVANPQQKAFGAILAGDARRAMELVDSDPLSWSNSAMALGRYIPIHQAAGDVDSVMAYYEAEIKTPQNAMQAAIFCPCTPLPLLLALKETGHPDFLPLLDAW